MPITLSLVPTRPSFCPGDVLTATLEVKNVPGPNDASAGPLELAGVNVDFQGTERIDRSWISNSYAPSRGPVARDGKREVRPIIETPPARLIMQDYTLMLGESRMWLVRFRLPKSLPPTFKGVAVRYAYTLQATAQFAPPRPFTASTSMPLSLSASLVDPVESENPFAAASAADQASSSTAGGPGVWGNSSFAGSVAQVESAVEASEMKAPSRWQTAETAAVVHLWPPSESFVSRGASGSVAAGEEAALPAVPYQLGYALRDVGVDFQELGEDAKARAGRQHSFSFLQQHGEQLWQPAFLTSIDHQPSQSPPTPRLANPRAAPDGPEPQSERPEQQQQQQQIPSLEEDAPTPFSEVSFLGHLHLSEEVQDHEHHPHGLIRPCPDGPEQHPQRPEQQQQQEVKLEEDTLTPFSELTLNPGDETDDLEMPHTASSTSRSARSAMTTGRQNSLTSPHAASEAVLRSYNLRLGEAALVRVALHAPLDGPLVLGSVLAGTFDFRASQGASSSGSASPKCVQVAVLLETEEVISEGFQSSKSTRLQNGAIRKVWDEHVEVTSDLMLTHFLFSLPLDAPASFATHLVALRWVLRFEFTTSVAKPAGWLSGGASPEQIVWSLPVLVRPPVAFA